MLALVLEGTKGVPGLDDSENNLATCFLLEIPPGDFFFKWNYLHRTYYLSTNHI